MNISANKKLPLLQVLNKKKNENSMSGTNKFNNKYVDQNGKYILNVNF